MEVPKRRYRTDGEKSKWCINESLGLQLKPPTAASFVDFKSVLLCYCEHRTHPSWFKQKMYFDDIRQLTESPGEPVWKPLSQEQRTMLSQHLFLGSPKMTYPDTTMHSWPLQDCQQDRHGLRDWGSLIRSRTYALLPTPSITGKKELVNILGGLLHICSGEQWGRMCSTCVGTPPTHWHHPLILDYLAGRDHPARKIGKWSPVIGPLSGGSKRQDLW